MSIHLVNPSDTSFGTAVITPRWLYVLAAATAPSFGDPEICDETLEHLDLERVQPGDVVLLCSDGLWEIGDRAIAAILAPREAPSVAVQRLVDRALEHGSTDDTAAVIIEIGE